MGYNHATKSLDLVLKIVIPKLPRFHRWGEYSLSCGMLRFVPTI
jgi:hypothetical protein